MLLPGKVEIIEFEHVKAALVTIQWYFLTNMLFKIDINDISYEK